MDLKIKSENEKRLFSRKEIVFESKENVTPSYEQLKAEIAKLLKTEDKLVVIKKIKHRYGTSKVLVNAYAYNNEEAYKKHETIKEKKKEAAAAAK